MEFQKKVALVTGAGTRLGQQISIYLASIGMRVAIHYNQSEKGAQSTLSQISKTEKHALFSANLCDLNQIQQLVNNVTNTLGTVSVLINSAAAFYPTPVSLVTEEQWDHLFQLNLKAPFFLSQQIGEQMKSQGEGKIINMADVSAYRPWANFLPYCITKSGLITLTQGLAKAFAPQVHVNAIAPGTVLPPLPETELNQQKSIDESLLKRMGSADDIVDAVDYLLHGDFLTGIVLPVDGGRSVY
ncbi:MAG: SDR family NAD(P)-dependent oxidoreductase [SAR324 cluster bacterium]|nr:SDR family NAD(P)-dependent oxidoreductase [SAR324 cluster bacterium]